MTVALFLVSRTGARHDGHVYGVEPEGTESRLLREAVSWNENHSFKHAPQKVWRQSRRVRG